MILYFLISETRTHSHSFMFLYFNLFSSSIFNKVFFFIRLRSQSCASPLNFQLYETSLLKQHQCRRRRGKRRKRERVGSRFLRLCVPKDLTAGNGKPAQMSVEEVLARGEGEGGGSYRNTEAERCSGVTSQQAQIGTV